MTHHVATSLGCLACLTPLKRWTNRGTEEDDQEKYPFKVVICPPRSLSNQNEAIPVTWVSGVPDKNERERI